MGGDMIIFVSEIQYFLLTNGSRVIVSNIWNDVTMIRVS